MSPRPNKRPPQGRTKLVIHDPALLARQALGDLDEPQLDARADLVEPDRAPGALPVVAPDVVVRELDGVRVVVARGGRGGLVAAGARLAARAQEEVRDVLLAAEVEDARGRCGGALEDAAHAAGDAVGPDGDEEVAEVDGGAGGVVGEEDDAAGGGEGYFVGGDGGEEGLEGLCEEGEVLGGWVGRGEGGEDELVRGRG